MTGIVELKQFYLLKWTCVNASVVVCDTYISFNILIYVTDQLPVPVYLIE